jgi:hypothetical protein
MQYSAKMCDNCGKPSVFLGGQQIQEEEAVAITTMLLDAGDIEEGKFTCVKCDPPVDVDTQLNTPVEVNT